MVHIALIPSKNSKEYSSDLYYMTIAYLKLNTGLKQLIILKRIPY